CDVTGVFHWEPARQRFRMIAHHGLSPELVPDAEALTFQPGVPFGGRVADGQTVFFNDAVAQPWLPATVCERFQIAALIAAPLRVRNRQFGAVVAVRQTRSKPFEAAQVELCEGIARQLAVGIEAAELYRAQQEETQIAAALSRVGREMISALNTPLLLQRL